MWYDARQNISISSPKQWKNGTVPPISKKGVHKAQGPAFIGRCPEKYVDHYNIERLHSVIGYIAPLDKLNGRDQDIFDERKRKLVTARKHRKWQYEVQRSNDFMKPGDWNPVDVTLEIEEAVVVG